MNTNQVFQYSSAKRFLLDYVETKKKADPKFSIRRWSKEMGMNSHALLIMILQGKRALTLKQVPFLAKGFGLSTPERTFFQALVHFENARSDEEKDLCRLWLAELNQDTNFSVREVDEYLVISHWVHMAILSMTNLKNFEGSAEAIAKKLGNKVEINEVRAALARLLDLGLLKFEEGKLKATYARVTTKDDLASRGAREYHKQVANLAADQIDKQHVDQREYQSFALTVPTSKITLAKEMIRKFRTQFSKAMTEEAGDELYQMNIHFFRLTESSAAKQVDDGADTALKKSKEISH